MEDIGFTKFTIGQQFPGVVPHREGAIMELWEVGPVVLIQYPKLKPSELDVFNEGFRTYSYLESQTPIPIAVWVFDFPDPHGAIDSTFNARVVEKSIIENYLSLENGDVKKGIYFFLLDGKILRGMRLVGLHTEAVEMFHATIRKQLDMDFNMNEFLGCLGGLFTRSTRELYEMGRKFQHG